MKLRIRGNSLRLRLQQSEVARFVKEGRVEETTAFGPGGHFRYVIESSRAAQSLQAHLEPMEIRFLVPKAMADSWATTDQISMVEDMIFSDGQRLRLLIEKDFHCLKPRSLWQEDESDAFPNPNKSCGEAH